MLTGDFDKNVEKAIRENFKHLTQDIIEKAKISYNPKNPYSYKDPLKEEPIDEYLIRTNYNQGYDIKNQKEITKNSNIVRVKNNKSYMNKTIKNLFFIILFGEILYFFPKIVSLLIDKFL